MRIALLLALASTPLLAQEKPNFVVLFADDLGYGDLGVYGSETIRTPRLDRMAAEGLRFTDFYAGAPFCSPSRAALLTGRYPVRAGVPYVLFPTETTGLPQEEVTLAELLRGQGYATAAIGKWHLGYPEPFRAQRHGFDFFYGLPYSNDMYRWRGDEVRRAQHAFIELPLMEDDHVVEAPVDQHTLTQRYTGRAERFIREHQDEPFFLYLPHTFPHNPQYSSSAFEGRSPHGLYADSVEELDWSTGRLLDLLAELDLDEKTLVLFTSDNGPTRGNPNGRFGVRTGGGDAGPLRGRKGQTFEGGVRVPAIFRWPGRIAGGRETDQVASVLDLLPTLVELAGGDPPTGTTLDGRSIAPLLLDPDARLDERPFLYYFGVQLQAIRQGRWKLFLPIEEYPEYSRSLWYLGAAELFERHHRLWPQPTLYDLVDDIGETRDVAADHPEVVERLTGLAERLDDEMQRHRRQPVYLEDAAR